MSYLAQGSFDIANDFRETSGVYTPVSVAARGNAIRLQTEANKWAAKMGKPAVDTSGVIGPSTVSLVNTILKTSYVAMQVAMLCSELADKLASNYRAKYGTSSQITSGAISAGKTILSSVWNAMTGKSGNTSAPPPASTSSSGGSLLGGSTGLVLIGGAVAAALYFKKSKSKRKK